MSARDLLPPLFFAVWAILWAAVGGAMWMSGFLAGIAVALLVDAWVERKDDVR